jgi:hypothetical protein
MVCKKAGPEIVRVSRLRFAPHLDMRRGVDGVDASDIEPS